MSVKSQCLAITSSALALGALTLTALSGGGCSGAPTATTTPSAQPTVASPSTSASAQPSATALTDNPTPKFEVHEWGLVDVGTNSAKIVAGPHGGPPPKVPRTPSVRKPVIYFHTFEGATGFTATVRVNVPKPGIVEYAPSFATLDSKKQELTWTGIHVRKGACHFVPPSGHDAPSCSISDGCEIGDLPNYETDDSACLEGGGSAYNLLFYRSAVTGKLGLPFDVVDDGKKLTITHNRGDDFIGPIVFVHRDGDDSTAAVLNAPDVGQSIQAEVPRESDNVLAQQAIDRTIREIGLTQDEVAAFDRAWSAELYNIDQGRKVQKKGQVTTDFLLFALPASMIDGLSQLTIQPTPTAIRRFFLVRMAI